MESLRWRQKTEGIRRRWSEYEIEEVETRERMLKKKITIIAVMERRIKLVGFSDNEEKVDIIKTEGAKQTRKKNKIDGPRHS